MADVRIVVVRHNLVEAIRPAAAGEGTSIPRTPLEVSAQLAANYQAHRCIDGDYAFDDPARARVFALLCLEFAQGLVEKRRAALESLAAGAEWRAG